MVILITGGAGSLGSAIVDILGRYKLTKYTRVLDINEAALADIKVKYPDIRTLYGDISDRDRVNLAMKKVGVCVHTAALKNINITEYNIPELIRINVTGTLNLVRAAIDEGIGHFIFISSDKAVNPTTIYGATKLISENIVKWAGSIQDKTGFTIVRPGNFWRSRGNVFEIWERQYKNNEPLTLTDKNMIRYFIDVEEVAKLITEHMGRPEWFSKTIIPKMKRYLLIEELKKRYPDAEIKITGKRPGEKLMEELWSDHEKPIDKGDYWEVRWSF